MLTPGQIGYEDNRQGKARTDNPYRVNQAAKLAWLFAWDAAEAQKGA